MSREPDQQTTHETPVEHHAQPPPNPVLTFVRERWQALSAIGLLGAGIVFVLLGWYGAANTNVATEQIPYLISGGLLGLGLIIVSGFLAYGAAAERRNDEFRRTLAALVRNSGSATVAEGAAAAAPTNGRAFTVPGGRSFHLAGCPIIEGKDDVGELSPGDAVEAGLVPCKLCGPD